jgi:NADH-quinone oxidoreductase subunit L
MLIGSMTISGLPLLSAFFSKDEILYSSLTMPLGCPSLYWVAVFTAFLTALYTGRLMAITFLGPERFSIEVKSHLHESPMVMILPLYILAALAVLGGLLRPHAPIPLELPPTTGNFPWSEHAAMIISAVLGTLGLYLGMSLFRQRQTITQVFKIPAGITKLWENKYYVDELYQGVFCRPLWWASRQCVEYVDRYVFDYGPKVSQCWVNFCGQWWQRAQNGDLQRYLLMMLLGLGLIFLTAWMVY